MFSLLRHFFLHWLAALFLLVSIQVSVAIANEATTPPVVTVTHLGSMDAKAATELIETFEDGGKQKSQATVIVATDHPKLAFTDSDNRNSKSLLLPLGKLTQVSERLKAEYRDYLSRVNDTIMNDKVSVLVVTATTAVDSVVWIQATTLDMPQKLGMVSLNLFLAVTFGLDRDLWGKITNPIRDRWQKTLQNNSFVMAVTQTKLSRFPEIISQLGANFVLGSAVFFARDIVLNFQNLLNYYSQTESWTHWLRVSLVLSSTHFAWSEIFSKTDSTRNPVAKLNLKRITDLRYLVLVSLASMGMVFQPEVYGLGPIFILGGHGLLGVALLLQHNKLIGWLENNRWSKAVYDQSVKFETWVNTGFRNQKPLQLQCSDLF